MAFKLSGPESRSYRFMGFIKKTILSAVLLLSLSCENEPIYSVPANIQPYIDEFLAEAAARGYNIEIEELVVLFEEDLVVDGVSAAGLCSRSRKDPPTIKLDTTSVNWRANLSSREQLVFHELGHCVLNLNHLTEKLENGNYVTMMRPSGEQIYGPLLSAFKRSYYLDQLFDASTTPPSWSMNPVLYDDVPASSKTLVYEENFNDNSGAWPVGESANTRREITSGVYILTVKVPDNYYVGNTLAIDDGQDFEYEAGVHVDGDGFSGILWAGDDRGEEVPGFNTVFFDDDVISIGTIDEGTESSYVYSEYFTEFYNKMTIRRIGGSYFYYVNGNLVDNMDFNGIAGDRIGLAFGGLTGIKVIFDYLKLSYLD